jgi:heme-degrading monooxygenase HmoA
MISQLNLEGGYIYIWRYHVSADKLSEFLNAYGPDGEWVSLFKTASGYLSTELLHDREREDCYITIDRWRSLEAFNKFMEGNREAFQTLDARCEGLTISEEQLGMFTDNLGS